MDDPYEAEVIITMKPYQEPEILFNCAICDRGVPASRWHNDGRSRPVAPFCIHCEMTWGGTNLSSWPGAYRMDARMARQVKAAAEYLGVLAHRKKGGWSING